MPCGKTIEPRTICSACLESIPSRTANSTVWSNRHGLIPFGSDEATRALVESAHPDRVVQLESPLPFGEAVRTIEPTLDPST